MDKKEGVPHFGLLFETETAENLQMLGCSSIVNGKMDHKWKTDRLIDHLHGRRLTHPVGVQLTLRCDNKEKISGYLMAQRNHREMHSLYVEVESNTSAAKVARAIVGEVIDLARSRRRFIRGLRVKSDGSCLAFDLGLRLNELNGLVSAKETTGLRLYGRCGSVLGRRLLISCGQRLFAAEDRDFADARLAALIRKHRSNGCLPYNTTVSFLPSGCGSPFERAEKVRLVQK